MSPWDGRGRVRSVRHPGAVNSSLTLTEDGEDHGNSPVTRWSAADHAKQETTKCTWRRVEEEGCGERRREWQVGGIAVEEGKLEEEMGVGERQRDDG